ncbi:cysteine desulfurase [Mesorhizobium sp. BR1-1-16]|uniref:cysteine desulfurase family protein n=1 Tax=Mesorhizobium sp. BR1-1-16 TaxID=2876653 RepID=UPI001CCE58D9|nr:cysteine desulfurase family protein [Mesorhizobium sp. BR1-1-16]MBZ9935370.1 cysteine desulfurase [Mesorhizobium sp. BR1-1-16]
MTRARIYLDYNAGAPLRPQARAAMIEALQSVGNPSSVHAEGRAARGRIEAARRKIATLVGGSADRVIFTSGGTEANVTVLSPRQRVGAGEIRLERLIIGATEHPSVLAGGRFAADQIDRVEVDDAGVIRLDHLEAALAALPAGQRALVSVMLANNETGTIQPVAEIARIARRFGALVHADAIQAAGRMPVDIAALGVDFLTLSAHKLGGPQGIGAIVLSGDLVSPLPLVTGGGQEKYARAGTENVAAIAGFGAAAEASLADLGRLDEWRGWRDDLAALPGAVLVGAGADRLPQTAAIAVDGLRAETLVIALDLEGVAISAGSACSSGKVQVSHVMRAMRLADMRAGSVVRLSFGWETTQEDISRFGEVWGRVLSRLMPGMTRAA